MVSVENISVQFSGEYLFHSVSFKINPSDKIGVVGPNGCGKTTLLKILAKEIEPESGSVNFQKGLNIGYLPQDYISEVIDETLFNEVYKANREIFELESEEKRILDELKISQNKSLIDKLDRIQSRLHQLKPELYKAEAIKVLLGLGFIENDFSRKLSEFSGGWRVRVAIAKLLLSNADLLLLDEPTNHLDFDSLEFLISYLKKFKGALLVISHDTHFLNSVTDKTLGFSFGKVILFNGNAESFYKYQEEQKNQLYLEYKNQQKKIRHIERFIERFRYKATKARQVQSRIKMLEKLDKIEIPDDEETVNFNFDNIPPSGKVVVKLENVSKYYNEKLVLKDINLQVDKGDKIAIVGLNGSGKSTLSKILADKEEISFGRKIYGHNVIIGYYSQNLIEELDLNKTVLETVENIDPEKTQGQVRKLLGCFLFHGDDVFKKVAVLSGGEKSRLVLLKILLQKSNFLILDEPTNHLDRQSKKILQDALIDYDGTLIIVSHDVDFVNPIVNKVIEIKNNSLKLYYGNLDDLIQRRKVEENFENVNSKSLDLKSKEANLNQRKVQRRIEAEKRQKFYSLTKELRKRIEFLENEISRLEEHKKSLEKFFTQPELVPPDRNIFQEYKEISERIDQFVEEWSNLSEEYSRIEKEIFSE
ncbi:MAG: ATP-binding cassette domain-containing protein [Ignavibacteria bacterium]|nr:ATP-binding cassette domain-containing protein [Ignavibacteria bacterium]